MANRLFGEWGRFRSWAAGIKAGVFRDSYDRDLRLLAEAVQLRLRQHIQSQDLQWPALSSETIRKKGFEQIYLETGDFLSGIHVKVEREGRFSSKMVVGPEGTHASSGLPMQVLAAYLEFGTSKIPARPLWRPTMLELQSMPQFASLKNLRSRFSFQ